MKCGEHCLALTSVRGRFNFRVLDLMIAVNLFGIMSVGVSNNPNCIFPEG